MHEWCHYLEHRLYRSDTPGGPHSRQSFLDMRVAFSEGFANAFAAMMLDDPLFRDTLGPVQGKGGSFVVGRSGEHTSELQSRGHLVCRLLLERETESSSVAV